MKILIDIFKEHLKLTLRDIMKNLEFCTTKRVKI